jgi:hypothetical protein
MATSDSEFDVQRLRTITNEMINAITSPAFVEAMRKLREAAPASRLSEGSKLLSTDSLRAAGVPLPKDMLISSRYFEPDTGKVINGGDFQMGQVQPAPGGKPAAPGVGGCACGGGLSFCGGAGGST